MKTHRHNSGFTLVEMLAGTALSALFMLAVLAVIGAIGRGQKIFAEQSQNHEWSSPIMELLKFDLGNAVSIEPGKDDVVIKSFSAFDREDGQLLSRPVTVRYKVNVLNGRRWLVRQQRSDLDAVHVSEWSELVCPDVQSLELHRSEAARPADEQTPQSASAKAAGPIDAVRVNIVSSNPKRPAVDRVLWIR